MSKRAPIVLIVEDNLADAELLGEAFGTEPFALSPTFVRTAEDAFEAVRAQRPDVMLIDLNLPGAHGLDVIRALRADARTAALPLLVLTSSADEREVDAAYVAGASAYLTKPFGFSDLLEMVGALKRFWLGHVVLPHR